MILWQPHLKKPSFPRLHVVMLSSRFYHQSHWEITQEAWVHTLDTKEKCKHHQHFLGHFMAFPFIGMVKGLWAILIISLM